MSNRSRELSLFGVGNTVFDHNMIVVMARIVGQSEPLIPNMQAALSQSHSFDPKTNKLIEYDVEDAIDRAKTMLKDEFQSLRKTTLINICAVCEQFVKTVSAERQLEFDQVGDEASFNDAFEKIDKKFRKISEMAAEKFIKLLQEFKAAPVLPSNISSSLNEVFLVRNAFVHNGGKVDKRLAKEFPSEYQQNALIVISAESLNRYIQSINSLTSLVFKFNWGSEL